MPSKRNARPVPGAPHNDHTRVSEKKRNGRSVGALAVPEPVRRAVEQGLSVVPQLPSKRAFFPWKEYQQRPADMREIRRWHREHPSALWALVTGQTSQRVVFDFDGEAGMNTLRRLKMMPTVFTPRGGAHVWSEAPTWPVQGGARIDEDKFPGMDLRADGQLATFYGRTEAGEYRPANPAGFYRVAELPERLQELLADRERRPPLPIHVPEDFAEYLSADGLLAEALDRVKGEAPRNETGFWLACQARDERLSFDTAVVLVHNFADGVSANGSHPYTYQEAYNSVVSAYTAPPRAPRNLALSRAGDGYMRTDYGNAERLVALHGEDFRYCHAWRQWIVWDGKRWQRDATAEVLRFAKKTVRHMRSVASKLEDPEAKKALIRWSAQSESSGRIRGMVRLAESEPGVPVLADDLDADAWLLNALNGTMRLRKERLRPHRRDDLLTKMAPVDFVPDAKAPRWEAFLERVLPDPDDRAFLRRAVGYSMTGDTSEQVMFLLYGTGANGKSTFLEVIRAILGDYAQQATSDFLLSKRPGSIPSDIARIQGARFVSTIETDEGRHLSEALVKQLTGGDRVTARFLYQDLFEFTPVAKFWLATNHKPDVKGTDEAIWRRLRVVEFGVQIPARERDPHLKKKLLRELPGIFNWALTGLAEWMDQRNLGTTKNIRAATKEYRHEQDVFGRFLEEACVVGDERRATTEDLFHAYQDWAIRGSVRRPMNKIEFGKALGSRGFRRIRIGKDKDRGWRGVGLPRVRRTEGGPHVV